MIIAFELSMPRAGSWDGKWSGANRPYVRCESFRGKKRETQAAELIDKGSFYYDFGDGWGASISVREVDSKEAAKLRRTSAGFCGYDWMITDIKTYGRIRTLEEREETT